MSIAKSGLFLTADAFLALTPEVQADILKVMAGASVAAAPLAPALTPAPTVHQTSSAKKDDCCPLHDGVKDTAGNTSLGYSKNSSGAYSTFAPSCTGGGCADTDLDAALDAEADAVIEELVTIRYAKEKDVDRLEYLLQRCEELDMTWHEDYYFCSYLWRELKGLTGSTPSKKKPSAYTGGLASNRAKMAFRRQQKKY